MITIAIFVNTYLRRSESFIYEQLRAIRSFRVTVLARDIQNIDLFPWHAIDSVQGGRRRTAFFDRLRFIFLRHMPRLVDAVRDRDIKLVHAHFGVDGTYAAALCRRVKVPLIVTFHGHDITRLPRFTLYPVAWFIYWLHFNDLRRTGSRFLAVSDFVRARLVAKGFPPERTFTHYLGIDTAVPFAFERSGSIVLFAARLVEKKGAVYLIEAMARVRSRIPEARLVLCGDGPLAQSLQRRVRDLGISDAVEFAGWQTKEDLFRRMSQASVFVLPSITAHDGDCEGLGMVLLEAMARGTPVVGTRHGGIPDVICDGENGFLVPERDADRLAARISELLSDPSVAQRFARAGRKTVETKFNIIRQAAALELIYAEFVTKIVKVI